MGRCNKQSCNYYLGIKSLAPMSGTNFLSLPEDVQAAVRHATRGLRTAPPIARRPHPLAVVAAPPRVVVAHLAIAAPSRAALADATAALPHDDIARAIDSARVAAQLVPTRPMHSHASSRAPAAVVMISAPHERHLTARRKAAHELLLCVPLENQLRALGVSKEEYEAEQLDSPGSFHLRMLGSLAENKGDLNAARTTLASLVAYLRVRKVVGPADRSIPQLGSDGRALEVGDYHLDGFITSVTSTPAARKRRRVALQLLRDAAGFRLSVGRQCRKKLVVSGTRPKPKAKVATADPAAIYHLELLAGDRDHRPMIRMSAAMAVAGAHICLRGVGSQRAGQLCLNGEFLAGVVGADYKKDDETITLDRPFCAPALGLTGTDDWARQLQLGLRGVEHEMFLIRDTDSPDGDPRRATRFEDGMMPEKRALNMLRSLMYVPAKYNDGYHPCPSVAVDFRSLSFKHLRRYMPAMAKALGESKPDRSEIGAWAGSQAERIDGDTLDEASRAASVCADLYATEGAQARAPYIMLRVSRMARSALQASLANRKCRNGFADLARMQVMGHLQRPGAGPPVLAVAAPAARLHGGGATESAPVPRGRVAWHGPPRIGARR